MANGACRVAHGECRMVQHERRMTKTLASTCLHETLRLTTPFTPHEKTERWAKTALLADPWSQTCSMVRTFTGPLERNTTSYEQWGECRPMSHGSSRDGGTCQNYTGVYEGIAHWHRSRWSWSYGADLRGHTCMSHGAGPRWRQKSTHKNHC